MQWTPYRHQQIALDFLRQHDRAALFIGMGLGKTVTSLTVLAEHLWDDFTVRKCLVIAPLNVAKNVWAQECHKWDHLRDIRCSLVCGDLKHRVAALNRDADLYIINRENVQWLMENGGGIKQFDMVIIDELSSFKSASAKRWKVLKKEIRYVRYVVGLTGTPASNGYLDLWPEMYLIDGGERLGRTLGEYRVRYFHAGAHKGHIIYEYIPNIGATDAINRRLSDICLSMSSEDWLDLPDTIPNVVRVSMEPEERKLYDKMEREKVIPLLMESGAVTVLDPFKPEELAQMTSSIRGDTAATIAGKLLQMAGGAVYDDSGAVIPIHNQKIEALREIIEANPGEPILCFYNYQHEKDRILAANLGAIQFDGENMTVEKWNRGEIPLLLCHPASAGHGLNLQTGGHIIVWFGLNWSLELYQQANARLSRPGQKHNVMIHHIVCRGTVDERVMSALQGKDTVQSSLLDALKDYLSTFNDEEDTR